MDHVEAFFATLPSPIDHEAFLKRQGQLDLDSLLKALGVLFKARTSSDAAKRFIRSSSDSDFQFLVKRLPSQLPTGAVRFVMKDDVSWYWSVIGHLALTKTPAEISSDTATARQLRYFRWIAQGRKDVEREQVVYGTSTKPVEQYNGHPALPKSSTSSLADHDIQHHACAHCHKTEDTSSGTRKQKHGHQLMTCTGCALPSGNGHRLACTYYCGKQCQKADWPRHKPHCIARQGVLRAATLLRDLVFALEAHAALQPLRKLWIEDGITNFEDRPSDEAGFLGTLMLQRLECEDPPSTLAYHAALGMYKCNLLMLLYRHLFMLLFTPLCKDIRQFVFEPRNADNPLCHIDEAPRYRGERSYLMFVTHAVLQVTLVATSEVLAVDITAAQFGWQELVAPWGAYMAQRSIHVSNVVPFHANMDQYDRMAAAMVRPVDRPREYARQLMAACLVGLVHAALGRHSKHAQRHGSAQQVLKSLEPEQYAAWAADLVDWAYRMCAAMAEGFNSGSDSVRSPARPAYRWYFSSTFDNCLTQTDEQVRALKGVWMSEAEVAQAKGDPAKIQRKWLSRCATPKRQALFKKHGVDLLLQPGPVINGTHRTPAPRT
ncbi:uncharacterized protein B0I36DRAFT_379103 [Microdochium trichocladiopsis]|uniref:MYND-type domain-containing protein n=1 Tax=Microdochium trichocladiopsis TaxID=1682393 RepID=A0A9P8YDY5_9PEZI|nr:uncharacterized protein B0I36DRAFT_379103 [Microdochium trichocladiopsis]KAH7040037.1 hypothetical protein B0I36DRAFT_379103 [Microdochium trichocladiopsis]